MEYREVRTQTELNKALGEENVVPICVGDGFFRASGSAQVRASDSAQVRASDSAQVEAFDSAQVRASGSAQVRAFDSAQVRASGSAQVRASDSAQVRAFDSAQVEASKYVAVTKHTTRYGEPTVNGGVLIEVPRPSTPEEWCEYRGVKVIEYGDIARYGQGASVVEDADYLDPIGDYDRPVAILFKAVDDNFKSSRGGDYTPDTIPAAEDWDGGDKECGGGLHFCARPWEALQFDADATRFVACPVALEDIAVHEDASMPNKVKARRCAGPVWECDRDGARIEVAA